MKKRLRTLAGLIALLTALTAFAGTALAGGTYSIAVNQEFDKIVRENCLGVDSVTGMPPGLKYSLDGTKLRVYGTPTKTGTYNTIFTGSVQLSGHRPTTLTYSFTFKVMTVADLLKEAAADGIIGSIPIGGSSSGTMKITKHPTGEKVKAGGSCKFIARADNAVEMSWHLVSPQGKDYRFSKIKEVFPDLTVSGGQKETLTLENIPAGMNGWEVYCRFYSDKSNFEKTERAKLTVTGTSSASSSSSSGSAAAAATAPAVTPLIVYVTPEPEQPTPVVIYVTPEPALVPAQQTAGQAAVQGQGAGGSGQQESGGSGIGTAPTAGSEKPDHTALFVIAGAAVLAVLMLCGTLIALSRMKAKERARRDRGRYDPDDED